MQALAIDPRDVLLEKPRFGAFHSTDLEMILRCRGIDTIIITGISMPICCDTTAREANSRDFRVFFMSDGTATTGTDPEGLQRMTLDIIDGHFGTVLTVAEMTEMIERAVLARDSAREAH